MTAKTNRAAQIAHQIEQPAGVRHLVLRKVIERQRCGRKEAKHEGRSARHLLAEELPEIIGWSGKAIAQEADGEERVPTSG